MKKIRFAFISVLIALIAAGPAFGGGKKKKATPAPAYQQPVSSSVKGNAITVSDTKTTRAFTITPFTEINVNGQRANVADLKPGMTVNVTIGLDPSHAGRINAEGVPVDKEKKK